MLYKRPTSPIKKLISKGAIVLIVIETGLFIGSACIWYKLNTERDFRFYLNNNYPSILNVYYRIGETLGNSNIREIDRTYWSKESKFNEE